MVVFVLLFQNIAFFPAVDEPVQRAELFVDQKKKKKTQNYLSNTNGK